LGDVLISRANTVELVGAVVLVQVEPENLYLSDKILRLILDEDLKQWVLWFLRSPSGRDQIEKLATGNQLSMRNISQDALRSIQLPVPDKQARDILLATITSSFARADRLDFEAARAKKLLDRIESTILAKAFRGELVSQNPNDEPASALLTRIRAKRAAVPISKRRTKKYVPSHD
jgi:type I restriction enzyme S subunit